MSTVIFTSSSLRHKTCAALAHNFTNLNVIGIFHEVGSPLQELVEKKKDNDLELMT